MEERIIYWCSVFRFQVSGIVLVLVVVLEFGFRVQDFDLLFVPRFISRLNPELAVKTNETNSPAGHPGMLRPAPTSPNLMQQRVFEVVTDQFGLQRVGGINVQAATALG